MNILERFGSELKKKRIEEQLSQEKLAELADLHRTYVGAVERGERNISLLNIYKIATALNISIRDLFKNL